MFATLDTTSCFILFYFYSKVFALIVYLWLIAMGPNAYHCLTPPFFLKKKKALYFLFSYVGFDISQMVFSAVPAHSDRKCAF